MFGDDRSARLAYIGAGAGVAVGLYLASLHSYLLFHSLIEIATIAVASTLFVLTWNTRRYLPNAYLRLIGIGYGFVALLDLCHTLAYKGMGVFPGGGANLPTQFWIAARYLQAVTLLAAPFLVERRVSDRAVLGAYGGTVLVLMAMVYSGSFPDCFIEGKGLTIFKIGSEYLITACLLASLYLLSRTREHFDEHVFVLVAASIVFTVVSELSFTAYVSVYGFANLVGHFAKLAAFYLIYQAILVTGLQQPFDLIFRDLKQSEEALLKSQGSLEEKVRERTEALDRLNRELEQRVTERTAELQAANKELESFAYSVSHDLRAPLRHIDGYLDLLVSRCRDGLSQKGMHYVDTIAGSARQMGVLIDELLQFSRTGRAQLHRESLDMNQVLQEALTLVRESNAGRTIEWVIGGLPSVQGDSALLRQVWTNLLENAVKYTRPRKAARIEVSAREGDGEIVFAVADNGGGFDMKYADKLFGVFERLHSQDEFEGTGIGLATVQRIVTRHGGRVWADATLDQGATFYFTLPTILEGKHA